MSNLETDPAEVVADCTAPPPATGADAQADTVGAESAPAHPPIEILQPRDVPLGGPRAMTVRRTLPQRERSTIGAWCFLDHYGPDDVSATGGMRVPPHPHTGLQTVSWLFAGEIEHRDSVGSHAMVRPGELNLMTAGRGISHSEVSTPATTALHGVQLWVALPDEARSMQPFFEHYESPVLHRDGAQIRVFMGELAGQSTDVAIFSPLVAAQLDLEPGAQLSLDLNPAFEHGVLVDAGPVTVGDAAVQASELAYLSPGRTEITLTTDATARVILIGGTPLGEQLIMWWNFVGRSHDEVVGFREAWQRDVIDEVDASGRFGHVADYDGTPLPAPALPNVRLRPRR
ncbi:pirin family protein [Leifsonia sp. Root112D2]|uniref:pirin family protein n=1 Tax=Leifsonia sp. Root112D2 TaxID=1736426 RepID=UPI0007001414|nr:pirin family protein [Leifsonia sp. Root112D2]KQV07045.1 pirin [Leifsonia sp. Root112D2]